MGERDALELAKLLASQCDMSTLAKLSAGLSLIFPTVTWSGVWNEALKHAN